MILPQLLGPEFVMKEYIQVKKKQDRSKREEVKMKWEKTKPVESLERLLRRKAWNTKLEWKSAEIEGIGEKWSLGILRTDKRVDGKTEILSFNINLSNFELLRKEVSKIL